MAFDEEASKGRNRQPALPAGSQHDSRNYVGYREPSGREGCSSGFGAFGKFKLLDRSARRFVTADRDQHQELDAGKGCADQAGYRRNPLCNTNFSGAFGQIATR